MKNLFIQIKDSVYNPDFYKSLETKNASYTIYYALKLSAIVALVMAFVFTIMFVFFVKNYGGENLNKIFILGENYLIENYKDNYQLTFVDNILTSNIAEPIIFPIPVEFRDEVRGEIEEDTNYKDLENIVVIDPTKNYSQEELEASKAVVFLAKNAGGVLDEQKGRVQMIDYSESGIEELNGKTLTKEIALDYYAKGFEVARNYLPYVYVFIFFGCLAGLFVYIFVGMLIFAVWTGLLAFILAKLLKKEGDYGSWYLIAIRADTLPVLITYLLLPISLSISSITFFYTIFVLVIIYLNKFNQ